MEIIFEIYRDDNGFYELFGEYLNLDHAREALNRCKLEYPEDTYFIMKTMREIVE